MGVLKRIRDGLVQIDASIYAWVTRVLALPSPEIVRPASAQLSQAYHAYLRVHHRPPQGLIVGCDLYEMYEGELLANQRRVFHEAASMRAPTLFCKGAVVMARGRGYHISPCATREEMSR